MSTLSCSPAVVAAIFGVTYLALAVGKVPWLRMDRAGIAVAGAAAMIASGCLTLHDAARAVDYETIVLLFGMMVLVGSLRLSGFFAWCTDYVARAFSGPWTLLAVTIVLSGILSAFLVNDVICVAMTPLILHLCQRLKRPPIPYLVGLATASNIGSTATITGNPQNIIIGSLSSISYSHFAARLSPIALIGLILNFIVVAVVYRRALSESVDATPERAENASRTRLHTALMWKGLVVTVVTVALFFAGQPIAVVALCAAAVMMTSRVRPEKFLRAVDWPLLVMFCGLFVAVSAFESGVVRNWGLDRWTALKNSPVLMVSILSAALSNLVSNVPAVLLFEPLMKVMPEPEQAWLALAMSSTLAGNLTVLGSVANLIVVESARRAGTELSFFEYLKVGIPLTLLTLVVGIAWLSLTHY